MRRSWMISLAALSLAALTEPALAKDIVIHAGMLIDGSGQAPQARQSILIHDDRITGIHSGFQTPAGAEIIDLSQETVMPGFIDCHIHISAKLPSRTNETEYWLTHSALDRAFDAAVFARAMLQQGFTAGRDVGGGDETVALRNAINDGKVPGPRLWVSLEPLGPTAGHGDRRNEIRLADRQRHGTRRRDPRRDPLKDSTLFEAVDFVMKGGEIYRDHGAPTPRL